MHKDERRAAQILFAIIFVALAIYLIVILTSLYWNDWKLIWFALGSSVLLIAPLGLLARGHLRSSSRITVLGALCTATLLATIGQGMRDIAMMAFPVIIIISSLMLDRRHFTFFFLLTIGAVGWLVFGEMNGWFIPRPIEATNWPDFLMMTAILGAAIVSMDLLAADMRGNLELAQQEIIVRKQAEEALLASEALNRAVLNSVMANIAVVNKHGTIIAINEGWEQFALENGSDPQSPNVSVGANYLEVCEQAAASEGDEAQSVLNGIKAVLAQSQATFKHEYPCDSPTEQRWFSMHVSRLNRAEGGAVISHFNITESKLAENLIRIQRDLGLALGATTTLNVGLQICLQAALDVSGMDCGGIYFVEADTGALELVFHQGISPELIESISRYEADSASAQLVMTGEPIYSQHNALGVPLDEARKREAMSAIVILPIHHNGRVMGCLNIASHTLDEPPVFAQNVLEMMVFQLGNVIVRFQAETELRQNKERFEAIIAAAEVGTWDWNVQTGETVFNECWAKIVGYSLEEIAPISIQTWMNLAHPDDLKQSDALLEEHFNGKTEIYEFESRMKHKDGQWVCVLDRGKVVSRTADGKPLRMLGTHIDITARNRMKAALSEEEKRTKVFLNALPDLMFRLDRNGVYLDYKAEKSDLYTQSEDIIGKRNRDITPPEFADRIEHYINATLSTGEMQVFNYQLPIPDHGLRDYEARMIASGGDEVTAIARDITERKRMETERVVANKELLFQNEEKEKRLSEMTAVHNISASLRIAQIRDEVPPILLDETLTALETDAGVIWLYHPDSDELRVAASRGWWRQFGETPIKPGQGITGTVFATGQAHITTDFAHDPISRTPDKGQYPAGWSGLCLPIRTGSTMIGTLTVSLPSPRQFTPQQVKLLESLAEMGGATLYRMRLYEETMRQLDRLEALHSIDTAISASLDLHLTLDILLEQVRIELNADATDVLLLDPHSETLEYSVGRGFRTCGVQTTHVRLGEGFAGHAALERRTVRADDPTQIKKGSHFAVIWAGEGFATYYGVPLIAKGQVKGVLEVYLRSPFRPESDWISFLETLAGQAAIAIDSAQLFENLQRSNKDLALAYDATIEGWSHALDLRDKETEGHTQRVTEITVRLAKAMNIADAELVHIRRGALLHDIGKMGVPDEILLKPSKLTDEEWGIMRRHPQLAYDLISPITYLKPALDIPYCHHEKWDGTGYPRKLKGEQIPFAARLFAIIDVWDALRSDRPYRKAWDEEKVREHIRAGSGTHFDPGVVEMFLRVMSEKTEEHEVAAIEPAQG